jgi:transposase InsO family protein
MRSRHASRHPPPESRDLTETSVLSRIECEARVRLRIASGSLEFLPIFVFKIPFQTDFKGSRDLERQAVSGCTECVGIHAHARATRFQALEPIRQGVRQHFSRFAQAIARGLALRHDHGSQYISHQFQKEIAFLGIDSLPAFVRSPEGNGCAERFIRTLKENLLWVRTFETIEELRQSLLAFRETYNTTWLIERHGFLTPAQFRHKQLQTAAIAA